MRSVTLQISDDDLISILISAVEGGGIRYWAAVQKYNPIKGRAEICEHNDERDPAKWGPWKKVNIDVIARGLRLCSRMPTDEGGWAFTEWLKDRTGDSRTADNIVQFGVLRELKYG